MNQVKLSVIICTHNRADLLPVLLESLAQQALDAGQREILLVDNASTDNTRKIMDEFFVKIPGLRYIYEAEIGLSAARNRGWREAQGTYVGYLDDDCKAPPEWLSVAAEIVDKITPEVFGGPYYAFYNTPKPKWFKDEYGSHVQGETARPLNRNEYLSGGNMFIQRDLFESLGGFQHNLGMAGKQIAYGEETHFLIQLRTHDPKAILYYEPRLFVYHLVRAEKMNLRITPRRFFYRGRYSYRVFSQPEKQRQFHLIVSILRTLIRFFRACIWILYTLARIVKACTWGVITRNRVEYPFIENYIYECGFSRFVDLGQQIEALCQILSLNEQD